MRSTVARIAGHGRKSAIKHRYAWTFYNIRAVTAGMGLDLKEVKDNTASERAFVGPDYGLFLIFRADWWAERWVCGRWREREVRRGC